MNRQLSGYYPRARLSEIVTADRERKCVIGRQSTIGRMRNRGQAGKMRAYYLERQVQPGHQ